eukprot:m.337986 g.337986  ORF g.337986 m.337986 type:complete len:411 (+) comp18285_c0_seq1:139-1371(+)
MDQAQVLDRANSVLPGGTTTAVFVCQRCQQPLKLSLGEQLDVVAKENDDFAENNSYTSDATYFRKLRPKDSTAQLPASQRNAKAMFDSHSMSSDTDHPLCEECTDGLLDELDEKLRVAEDNLRICSEFLKDFKKSQSGSESNNNTTEALSEIQQEELELMTKLKNIEDERAKVKVAIDEQEKESLVLDQEEERHWKEFNEHERSVQESIEEQQGVEQQYQQACEQLERLKKTNVFNDAFHIWHDGHFGTINTFRLGRLPTVPVEWNEINAAWGQTVLLLHTMALKLNFKFSGYRLIPFGSLSRLERIDDSAQQLPLYHSGGFKFSFWDSSKFDVAMVAFLDCLQQFKDYVESQDKHFKLPYRINKDKIGDGNGELSIRTQHNHEETWTKALKFMLTNLKWSLAWVCKQPA